MPGDYIMADSVLGFSLSQSDQSTINLLAQADFIQEMSYISNITSITKDAEYTSITPQNTNWTSCYIVTHTVAPSPYTPSAGIGEGILRVTPNSGRVPIPARYDYSTASNVGACQYIQYNITANKISFVGTMSIGGSNIAPVQVHATFAFFL